MLTVAGLSKSFGGRALFDAVSSDIVAGDRIAIAKLSPDNPATGEVCEGGVKAEESVLF